MNNMILQNQITNVNIIFNYAKDNMTVLLSYIYLRQKLTLHISMQNIFIHVLNLSKWNIAISFQHLP